MGTRPKIAVVGGGHWGSNIIRNVARLGALSAVVDPNPAARINAEKIAPGVSVFPTLEDAFREAQVDAVMIATPSETHYHLACTAIAAGKHLFVEKPLTIDVAETSDLIERSDRAGLILMVGHLLEYHPAILKLHELVDNGTLGKLRYLISNRLNLGKIRTEESALWSYAPHDISVILRLVGKTPFEVVATGGSYITPNVADVTVSQLLFDNGVRSHIFVSWLHPFKEQKLVVIGSKKMATYDDVTKDLLLYDLHVEWKEGEPIPLKAPGVPVEYPSSEPLAEECEHFIDCVAHGRRPRTDGRSGLRVLQILHASQRSMMTNGCPIQLAPTTLERTTEGDRSLDDHRHSARSSHGRIRSV